MDIIIVSKLEFEQMLRSFVDELKNQLVDKDIQGESGRMNQREAAIFLGVTEATIIRWKKKGMIPFEQLPGSTKVTFYKSQLKKTVRKNSKLLR